MYKKILFLSLSTQIASGFNAPAIDNVISKAAPPASTTQLCMSESAVDPEPSPSSMRGKVRMSEAIPFLKCPTYLDGKLAGDVGFDPLGFGKNEDVLLEMREAEIKHARLAMLVSVMILLRY